MFKKSILIAATAAIALSAGAAEAKSKKEKRAAQIPTCSQSVGTVAIVEPKNRWWYSYKLESPQNIIKYFALKSGCFRVVDRDRGISAAQGERALAASGELQAGSNFGKGQMKAADFLLVPDLVSTNKNGGGLNIGGGILGGLGSGFGGLGGKVGTKKKEANVTLMLVDARTTEAVRLTEGYAKKKDLKWGLAGGGGNLFGGGNLTGLNIGGYENTDIGQVLTLAYLDAFKDMAQQMGAQINED